ncbi:carbohydrate ABC transporter permease [Halobium palmae]|uniref:Carbohydrate ABC transporter permease n=1 Tax=Halobium palmae TaxID=1776492 RepID=A0ABD5RV36_9EURY
MSFFDTEQRQSGRTGTLSKKWTGLKHRLGFREDQDNLIGLLFCLPNIVVFSIFLLGPVLYAFYLSFTQYSILRGEAIMYSIGTINSFLPFQIPIIGDTVIPGLNNYLNILTPLPVTISGGGIATNFEVFTDPTANTFWWSLKTTTVYAVGTVPFQIYGGLAVALLLDKRIRGKKAYRAAYFMPVMLSGAASAIIWRWLLSGEGVINMLLPSILEHNWAGNPATALGAVMLMAVWGGIGFNMVLFLAGLQNIPQELYDAARIDGANGFQRFRHVTWPNLDNTNFFIIVMAIIGAFQVFGIAMVFSQGGPYYATTTTVLLIYQRAFEEGMFGVGAAMAVVLFFIIFMFSYYQYRYRKSEEVDY